MARFFSSRQNRVLRTALKKLASEYRSQGELGDAIGIKQQNVSRAARLSTAGFSYATAIAIAKLSGHDSLESFFADRGVQ